jgi:photosystem II stability/assembly factor-like uncharacterized protein
MRKANIPSSFVLFIVFFCLVQAAFGQWEEQNSGTDVQLRGISAVSGLIAWASGANGTLLRTVDGGQHWEKLRIEGADKLDFRDIRGFDDKTAYALSIGPGEQSRIYKTTDGGQQWQLQFTNHDPKAFYDCFAFWDRNHGIAMSDSVDGKFPLLSTSDGSTWRPLAPQIMPVALPNEGAFASSGTCTATFGKQDVWFGTGGPAARVFHSSNRGKTWTVATTPILSGAASQGIFSVAFWDKRHGVIVGGDYMQPKNSEKNAAYTIDGGRTWRLSRQSPSGYRSAVTPIFDPVSRDHQPTLLAIGPTGSDISTDGNVWISQRGEEYNAVSFAGASGWAVGPHGRIGHTEFSLHFRLNFIPSSAPVPSELF